MSLLRKIGRILAILITLILTSAETRRVSSEEQSPKGTDAVESRGSDWTYQVNPDGKIVIARKGVTVITNDVVYWDRGFTWVGADLKFDPIGQGQYRVIGTVPAFEMKMTGEARSPAPNVFQMDLLLRAEKPKRDVIGGGWQWNFKLKAAALEGRASAPELLPDKQGWTWSVAPGQSITLRFEERAAKVYFERGDKGTIRTFFTGTDVEPGTQRLRVTLELPEGARRRLSEKERYPAPIPRQWFPDALAPNAAPVDLSFLNRDDRPAGRRGFVRADGDRLVFGDGSPARFWGGNVAAYALFSTPRRDVTRQAHRMAQLGYNLMRIHHHDSEWVAPNIFGTKARGSRRLDPQSLDSLDWWIKCLKDEGIYVWLDMHVGRLIKPDDGLTDGAQEIARGKGSMINFCYYNTQVQGLMKDLQRSYLGHLNRYTKLSYKDDPAIMAVLITNENDFTCHGGNYMLGDKGNPYHNALWKKDYTAFAREHNLPPDRVSQTWLPGPSKLHLSQAEHEFNRTMIDDLRGLGVKAPIATTNFWGDDPMFALAPLTDGDVIDVHSYGGKEEFDRNAHYQGNYLAWIAMGQVYGKPLTITEWNVPYPFVDRFTAPLHVASIASLQGWDAPMIYNYSQAGLTAGAGVDQWSTYSDPSITGMMPAAALLYRQGHVSPAKKTYCLMLDPGTFFGRNLVPDSSATVRTLAEQSRLTIGMPATPELPWLEPSKPSSDVIVVTDPDRDFIPPEQSFVQSDTGEVTRNWEEGIQTIDTPRTQAVSGWIGGRTIKTRDASFETRTKKAVVALTSVDNRPLAESRFILVTAVARADLQPRRSPAVPLRAGVVQDHPADHDPGPRVAGDGQGRPGPRPPEIRSPGG